VAILKKIPTGHFFKIEISRLWGSPRTHGVRGLPPHKSKAFMGSPGLATVALRRFARNIHPLGIKCRTGSPTKRSFVGVKINPSFYDYIGISLREILCFVTPKGDKEALPLNRDLHIYKMKKCKKIKKINFFH
jgi:hypothetical protein